MEILPAIDLMNGACVRLIQGKKEKKKIYFNDPLDAALQFEAEGAKYLHLVDLDAAMGTGHNTNQILRILKNVTCNTEVAGGIRTLKKASMLMKKGAFRVVLGTAALSNPDFLVKTVTQLNAEKIALSLDIKDNNIMIEGWTKKGSIKIDHIVNVANELHIGALIFTSIGMDGTLKGADLNIARLYRRKVKVSMIVAGGVSTLSDIHHLNTLGIDGIIIGKALYEKSINLKEALFKYQNS